MSRSNHRSFLIAVSSFCLLIVYARSQRNWQWTCSWVPGKNWTISSLSIFIKSSEFVFFFFKIAHHTMQVLHLFPWWRPNAYNQYNFHHFLLCWTSELWKRSKSIGNLRFRQRPCMCKQVYLKYDRITVRLSFSTVLWQFRPRYKSCSLYT